MANASCVLIIVKLVQKLYQTVLPVSLVDYYTIIIVLQHVQAVFITMLTLPVKNVYLLV